MNDVTQKKVEDLIFDFIEENFGKGRITHYNQVVDLVEKISNFNLGGYSEDDVSESENENDELELSLENAESAFESLKEESVDILEDIVIELEKMKNDENADKINNLQYFIHGKKKNIDWMDIEY